MSKRRIVPPVYFLAALLAMTALHVWLPLARFVSPPISYFGVVLVIAGLGIAGTAAASFAKAGTPVVPFETSTTIVTTGLYRFTRNPMYLGMILVLLGVALLFGTVTPLLPIPLFVWVIRSRFVLPEEAFLEELFGAEYLAYKSRVRRWL